MKNIAIYTLLTIVLAGTSTFFRKLSVERLHPFQLQIVAGLIYAVEIPIWLYLLKRQGITGYDLKGVLYGVLCILVSVISAVILGYLLKVVESPAMLSTFIATNPIVTLILCSLFLGEQITVKKVVGCVVTIIGLAIISL